MRVYELARELGLTTKELMEVLGALKISVKSHSSSLPLGAEDRVRKHVAATRPGKGKKAAGPPAPTPAPPTAPAKPEAKTPTGERIIGMRKIVLPPAPEPAPEEPAPPQVEVPTALTPELPAAEAVLSAPEARTAEAGAAAPDAPEAGAHLETPAAAAAAPAAPQAEAPPTAAPAAEGQEAAPPAAAARPVLEGAPGAVRIAPVRPPRREPPREAPREAPGKPTAPQPTAPPPSRTPPAADRRRAPTEGARPPFRPGPQIHPRRPMRRLPRRRAVSARRVEPGIVEAPPQVAEEIELSTPLSVGELATRLHVPTGEVVRRLLDHGVLAGINQQVPVDLAATIAEGFGTEVRMARPSSARAEGVVRFERLSVDVGEGAASRPPVVTVMGHVDHGKTTLLDAIRSTKVADQEFGGITQHIGASVVEAGGRRIVFIDTPGHEAFTALRARGAQVTDIAILVVAADDGVMPQTVEALNHAKAAGVPVIVAVNKMDLPQANPDRVKQELAERGLVPEEWGGETIVVPVSARQRSGIDHLLEMILLVADLQDLRADTDRPARGTIIEARLDRGRGPVATVVIQEGTLKVGDAVVAGETHGRVRAMMDASGERVDAATPSMPVEVLGLADVPGSGDLLEAARDERAARAIAEERGSTRRSAAQAAARAAGPAEEAGRGPRELRLIVKADTHGSVEALVAALPRLSRPEVAVTVVHSGVGNVIESDIMLASASKALVVGFNVRPDGSVRKLAESEHVDVRLYRVIYEAIDDLESLRRGMVAPTTQEVALGQAEVRQVFSISRIGTIAGSYVTDGKITRGALARLIRDGAVVYEGRIGSLRRFKEDVREVVEGFECGIGLERFSDIKERDLIEAYEIKQVAAQS